MCVAVVWRDVEGGWTGLGGEDALFGLDEVDFLTVPTLLGQYLEALV